MTASCPHGMPTPASCFECMEDGNLAPAAPPAPTFVRVFKARYDGDCTVCGFPIVAGQIIARRSDDLYVHKACT